MERRSWFGIGRRARLAVLLALWLGLGMAQVPAAPTPPQPAAKPAPRAAGKSTSDATLCSAAEFLASLKRAEEARAAYTTVLQSVPDASCAREGLQKLADDSSRVQELLAKAGDSAADGKLEPALGFFQEAQRIDPKVAEPAALKDLRAALALSQKAVRQMALGLPKDASATLHAALEKNARIDIPPALVPLFPGPLAGRLTLVQQEYEPDVVVIAQFVGAVLLLLLVVLALPRLRGYVYRAFVVDSAVTVGSVTDDTGVDPKCGDAFAGTLQAKLGALQAGMQKPQLSLVTGATPGAPGAVLVSLVPGTMSWLAKALGSVLDILSIPPLTLSGRLNRGADPQKLLVLTVQLARGSELIACETLRITDFLLADAPVGQGSTETPAASKPASCKSRRRKVVPADPPPPPPNPAIAEDLLDRLALVAAVWASFEARLACRRSLAGFGTGNWRSYALFQNGVAAAANARHRMGWLLRSLCEDENFGAARVYYAKALIDCAQPGEKEAALDQALGHLEVAFSLLVVPMPGTIESIVADAREALGLGSAGQVPALALFFRALFQFEKSHYVRTRDEAEGKKILALALDQTRQAMDAIRRQRKLVRFRALSYLRPVLPFRKSRALQGLEQFLDETLVQAELMYDTLLVLVGPSRTEDAAACLEAREKILALADQKRYGMDAQTQYNLACALACMAAPKIPGNDGELNEHLLDGALQALQRDFSLRMGNGAPKSEMADHFRRANTDPSLSTLRENRTDDFSKLETDYPGT